MQCERNFFGVDVAKDELVIATEPELRQRSIRNQATPITAWLREIPAGSCIAMESTGRYHAVLARLAAQTGMKVYVLNARDVNLYAKSLGVRGKTDAKDAKVIARYLAEHHQKLHEWTPGTPAQQQVLELLRRRAQIERHLSAVAQSLDGVAGLKTQLTALKRHAAKMLGVVDQKVQQLVQAEPKMRDGYRRLLTIVGIGPQTAAVLTAVLSRIDFRNLDAVVAFSGLDPRPSDSGHKRGRRVLTKRGPATLRRLLWLAAFSASHSKVFKPQFDVIKRKGLSNTESVVILARKILRIAWAVWRTGMPFDATKVAAAA